MNDKIATALIFLAVIFGLTAITLLCLFLSNKSPAAGTVQAETTEPIVAKTEPQPEQAKARADAAGVNVLDFGADPTGHEDSTPAIKAALRGNRILYFPAGTYLIDKLSISGSVTLYGDGDNATVLKTTNLEDNVISFRDGGWHVRDMKFDAQTFRTGGAYIFSSGDYASVENVAMAHQYIGIDLDGSWSVNLTNISALEGTSSQISEGGAVIRLGQHAYTGPINIRGLTARAIDGSQQPSYGIYMGYVDVVSISDALIIWHNKDVVLAPGARQFSALVEITNSCFDTAVNGIWIEPTSGGRVLRCGVSNTWFGAHSADAMHADASDGIVTGIQFSNCMYLANGGNGVHISGKGVDGIYFSNCFSGGNLKNGLELAGEAQNVAWNGGVIGKTHELNGNVGFGYTAEPGTSGKIVLADIVGNTAGNYHDPGECIASFNNSFS